MQDTRDAHDPFSEIGPDNQDRDVRVIRLIFAGIAILAGIVFVFVAIAWALNYFTRIPDDVISTSRLNPETRSGQQLGPGVQSKLPPAPRLQVNEEGDLTAIQASWERQLRTPAGPNDDGRTYHIPVEAAIELVAQPGRLPARDMQDTGLGAISDQDLESADSSGGTYTAPEGR